MSLRHRTAAVVALTGTAVLVPAVGAAAAQNPASVPTLVPAAHSGPRCDVRHAPHRAAGTYHRVFRHGPAVPHLAKWTPQGLSTWHNWDHKGHNLLLMGMYRKSHQSYLVGINPKSGKQVGTVRTKASHFGSLGVVGPWVIGQDRVHGAHHPYVRKYSTNSLRHAMQQAKHGRKPYLAPSGHAQKVHSVGFMAVTGKSVWLGKHSGHKPATMYKYRVDHSGHLHESGGPWKVPPRTQGVLVTKKKFIFASSHGHGPGKLTVVNRHNPNHPVACVTTPAMPENMTIDGNKVYASYESGAGQYAHKASSKVRDLRAGLLRNLVALGAAHGGATAHYHASR